MQPVSSKTTTSTGRTKVIKLIQPNWVQPSAQESQSLHWCSPTTFTISLAVCNSLTLQPKHSWGEQVFSPSIYLQEDHKVFTSASREQGIKEQNTSKHWHSLTPSHGSSHESNQNPVPVSFLEIAYIVCIVWNILL